jgi:AcrR family transcriptional regulator
MGRTYSGLSAAERVAERRGRLLDAALDLIGSEGGWGSATMTAICRRAGLTERYFYESFRDRDALYVALLDALAAEVERAVLGALRRGGIEASARALLDVLLGDPRKGRAALLEGLGSEVAQRRRREVLASFERLALEVGTAPSQLAAVALVGAVDELLTRRLDGTLDVSDEELVAAIVRLATP